MAKTYIWAQDAGHAWLAVKAGELVSLGIQDKISSYSYVKGSTVYLEEDCDFGLLYDACEKMGVKLEWNEIHIDDQHWIRRLPRYSSSRRVVYDCV